jgi:hypothetical protein
MSSAKFSSVITVDVGGMPVPLHLHGDDRVALRQCRDEFAEVQIDREQAAVQEHERSPAAMDFVVQPQPIDVGVGRCWHARAYFGGSVAT